MPCKNSFAVRGLLPSIRVCHYSATRKVDVPVPGQNSTASLYIILRDLILMLMLIVIPDIFGFEKILLPACWQNDLTLHRHNCNL